MRCAWNKLDLLYGIFYTNYTDPKNVIHIFYQDELPQSGPEGPEVKEPEADSVSTSSGGSDAGPDVTVLRVQPPVTPARQKSSDSNRTEPSDEKKGILSCWLMFEVLVLILTDIHI